MRTTSMNRAAIHVVVMACEIEDLRHVGKNFMRSLGKRCWQYGIAFALEALHLFLQTFDIIIGICY